jgi:hypothetical protein
MTGTTFGEGEASTATVSAFMLPDSPTPQEPGQDVERGMVTAAEESITSLPRLPR